MQVKFIKSTLLMLVWSSVVTTESTNDTQQEHKGDFFDGDIILTEEQKQLINEPNLTPRNGMQNPRARWPNRILVYRISNQFSAYHAGNILAAMNGIASGSCIRFAQAPQNARAYVNIVPQWDLNCYSLIGYTGRVQELILGRDCIEHIGIIQHELMHALGFYHQHSDPQRDSFVKINFFNVQRNHIQDFEKIPFPLATDFGVGYDYDSVMHYGPLHFSSNNRPTIETKIPNVRIGLQIGLSHKDFLKLNRMYGC